MDSFGNLRLGGGREALRAAFGERTDGRALVLALDGRNLGTVTVARAFGAVPPGATLLYVDSSGNLALADNRGDLAARVGATVGSAVMIRAS